MVVLLSKIHFLQYLNTEIERNAESIGTTSEKLSESEVRSKFPCVYIGPGGW